MKCGQLDIILIMIKELSTNSFSLDTHDNELAERILNSKLTI